MACARRASGRRSDPGMRSSRPGVGQAGGEHQRPGPLQGGHDPLQVGGDRGRRRTCRAACRSCRPAPRRASGAERHRLVQLVAGHVPDQRAGQGQVAQLDLVRRGQRAGQQRRPSRASRRCGMGSPMPRVTESPSAANRVTGHGSGSGPGAASVAGIITRHRPGTVRPGSAWGWLVLSPCASRKPATAAGQPNRSARARARARRSSTSLSSRSWMASANAASLSAAVSPAGRHLGQRARVVDHHRSAAGQRLPGRRGRTSRPARARSPRRPWPAAGPALRGR